MQTLGNPGARSVENILLYFRVYEDRFFRYPGIFEIIAGIFAGVLWTLQSRFSVVDLPDRPGFAVVTYYMPWLWEWLGLILAAAHTWGLFTIDRKKRVSRRAWACCASLVFWAFIGYGAAVSAVIQGKPVPMLVIPALVIACIHFALMVRLWKGIE